MSSRPPGIASPQLDERLNLTQTIRKLSMPTRAADDVLEDQGGTVLLLCKDGDSRKWGPRWLQRAGLQSHIPSNLALGLEEARSLRPDVIVVDSYLNDVNGTPLHRALANAADVTAPIIVLCSNAKETATLNGEEIFDVVRKPFEWQLISRRVSHAVKFAKTTTKLAESKDSLHKALALADAARQRLRSRENFEPVTGLPNKSKFLDLMRRGMAASGRDKTELAVMVIGFNRFRLVIEAMGQDQADLILTEIGRSLSDCLRTAATSHNVTHGLRTAAAASLDQFRFGIMLTCSGEGDELVILQQKLLDTLSRPIQVAGQTVSLSACLGVAVYPQDAADADSLLQRADNAMRDAQSRGGGFKYYCSETDAAAVRKLKIEHMLHEALDRNELSVFYQPIAGVASVAVRSAEALLRWQQADGNFVPPDEFVPIAEESGLIIRVGEYVLEEACRQLKAWRNAGIPLPHICVNVAKAQLLSSTFTLTVKRILHKHELEPGSLELELSERGVLSGDYDIINRLHELKNLGIRLSVDDFGTGESAIGYLRALPVDVLKIDRSYIEGLTINDKDAALVSAMVALGQRLNLSIVAEGVETPEQLAALRNLGCDAFQGFLVSRPVAGNAFAGLLKRPAS